MSAIVVAAVAAFVPAVIPCTYPETEPEAPTAETAGAIAVQYRQDAQRIIDATMAGNEAYEKLEHLCLEIGHRLSGSPQLDEAIRWALKTMKEDGQENVHPEKVMVPHWVRGAESATMVEPRVAPLAMLGLGGSVGTSPEGITAMVMVVEDEAQLDALGERAGGKIVLFNNRMPEYDPATGSGYGRTVRFRLRGARLASKHGAVGCLIRSVTANSLRTPHTGMMDYGDASVKIPAAALSTEDADMIAALYRRRVPVVVNLKMEAKTLKDAPSANVIAELRGSTKPDEIVVIGGHFDSWDVGHGTHDDGGGCIIAMEAINVLRRLKMIPKRTIRVVLWTNEENGLRGGKAYAQQHASEMENHVAAIESDSGIFQPIGYSVQCEDEARQGVAAGQMREITSLLATLGSMSVTEGYSGADIEPMNSAGVVLMGQRVEGSRYFDYHHSHADTIDKVDPQELSRNVAALATVAYILADMPGRLGDKDEQ